MNLKVITVPVNHDYVLNLVQTLREKNIEVYPMKYFNPWNLVKLLYLRSIGFKIIHLHFSYIFPYKWFWHLFRLYVRLLGFKIVLTAHSVQPEDPKEAEIYYMMFRESDLRFLHHKSHIPLLKLRGLPLDNLVHVFHPGFYRYKKEISKKHARMLLGIPQDKKVLLSFGLLKKYKGLEYFIYAMSNMEKEYLGLIVGRAHDKEYLDYLYSVKNIVHADNVRIIEGYVPEDEIQFYVNACDVMVIPYSYNIWTSGQVMLAYGFGKPVIGSKVGSMPEIVDKSTGILVPPKDVFELRKAFRRIFKKDYEAMGKQALALVLTHYNWDDLGDITIDSYKRLLEE